VKKTSIIWRIDDRLIHGQVIIGWCGQLPIDSLYVCDNEIAANDWEKKLLMTAAPSNIKVEVLSVFEIGKQYEDWISNKNLSMVLLKSPEILSNLIENNIKINRVNMGGMHFQKGRKEYLPYIFLSEIEIKILTRLMDTGIVFECQDLPTSPIHDLRKIIKSKETNGNSNKGNFR
jgi:mannose/fructose/N-acetylgalactosamine-specific phosphotransferase system component IIB